MHDSKTAPMSEFLKYRPEIDGLRAIAVLSVILFHAGVPFCKGGYMGVDVFFVLSGYLITSLILAEKSKGSFSLTNFYDRRARRILPALVFILLACLPFAWLWMNLLERSDFYKSLVAVGLFATNFLFWKETGYFFQSTQLIPLLHTWSLSLEEQFYLLFPLFLIWGWKQGLKKLALLTLGLSLLSFGLCVWGSNAFPQANFYLLPSRLWELLVGALTALYFYLGLPAKTADLRRRYQTKISAGGLLLILYAVFFLNDEIAFPSAYTLIPTLGTALLILCAGPERGVGRILAHPALVQIGLISYSAYLWHHPLFAFARLSKSIAPESVWPFLGLGLVALVLGFLTWKYVEQPFRNRHKVSTRFVFQFSGLSLILLVMVFSSLHLRTESAMTSLKQRLQFNRGLDAGCELEIAKAPAKCQTGPKPEILVWGDSYAMHLVEGILASDPKIALRQAARASCGPVLDVAPSSNRYPRPWSEACINWNREVLAWLKANPSVRYVVLSSIFKYYIEPGRNVLYKDQIVPADFDLTVKQFNETLKALRALKVQPILFSPPPTNGYHLGACLARPAFYNQKNVPGCTISYPDYLAKHSHIVDLLKLFEKEIPVVWLDKALCDKKNCLIEDKGTFMYMDYEHLSIEGSKYLGKKMNFAQLIRNAGKN